MSVLVYVELANGCVTGSSLEALTLARTLNEPVDAAVAGLQYEVAGSALVDAGVSTVFLIEHDVLCDYAPEAIGVALSQLLTESSASAMLGPGTETGQ
jgi:electron transfer flavoprotein alpha subunit